MKRDHMGVAAFTSGLSMENLEFSVDESDLLKPTCSLAALEWLDYLRRLVAVGSKHVQFLAPESVKDAEALGRIAKYVGVVEASMLYCTFHPVCPCADAEAAFAAFTKYFEIMKALLAPFSGTKYLFSPSIGRGLMDPDKGLAGEDDSVKQVAFLRRVLEYLKQEKRGEGCIVCFEPLNRFESRGPNTVGDTVALIKEAHAENSVMVGADSFHQLVTETESVYDTWTEFAPHIGLIHVSSRDRQYLYGDALYFASLFHAVARNSVFDKIPLVVEAFCQDTDKAFLPVLAIHGVSACDAAEMAASNLGCLRSWIQG